MDINLSEINQSVFIAIGIADEFNFDSTAFMDIANFYDDKNGKTEEALREFFSKAKSLGLEWHHIQYIMKYIQSEQHKSAQNVIGAIEIVRASMSIAEYFQIGYVEVLRFINLYHKYPLIKVKAEFTRAFNREFGTDLKWSQICHLILSDKEIKQDALKILHSQFL